MQNQAHSCVEVLLDADTIRRRVEELGERITQDYAGRAPLLVGVLRGAAIFLSDLVRCIDLPLTVDFMALSSYGSSTVTSGQVVVIKDVESDIHGADVIVVEDIVDTGVTLQFLLQTLERHKPASLRVCALLSKPKRRRVDVGIDYLGFEIPEVFVVGYGLDYAERHRHLRYVGVMREPQGQSGDQS
jgi:hypoxanthine phosphoribosyltransferase